MRFGAVKNQKITGVEFYFNDMIFHSAYVGFEMIPVFGLAEFPAVIISVQPWNTLKTTHFFVILISEG